MAIHASQKFPIGEWVHNNYFQNKCGPREYGPLYHLDCSKKAKFYKKNFLDSTKKL